MKTLKDLKKNSYGLEADLLMKDLRDAAREWIKEINKDKVQAWGINQARRNMTIDEKSAWIKHFFNLEDK